MMSWYFTPLVRGRSAVRTEVPLPLLRIMHNAGVFRWSRRRR